LQLRFFARGGFSWEHPAVPKCLPDQEVMQKRNKHRIIDYYCRIEVSAFAAIMFVLAIGWHFASGNADSHDSSHFQDLPRVEHSLPMRAALREDAITIAVERDGGIYFTRVQGKVSADALPKLIREKLMQGSEHHVFIRADRHAKFQTVRQVLQAMEVAQVERVSFLTDSNNQQPTNILRPE